MKLQINDTYYAHYKKIYEIIWTHYKTLLRADFLVDDADPVLVLNSWEQQNKSIEKRGLKIGLQDLISDLKDFPLELKMKIDQELLANELPALRVLQGIVPKTIAKVLKRGKINTLEEFYIVKEEVIDSTTDLTDDVRSRLDELLSIFENSKANPGKKDN